MQTTTDHRVLSRLFEIMEEIRDIECSVERLEIHTDVGGNVAVGYLGVKRGLGHVWDPPVGVRVEWVQVVLRLWSVEASWSGRTRDSLWFTWNQVQPTSSGFCNSINLTPTQHLLAFESCHVLEHSKGFDFTLHLP